MNNNTTAIKAIAADLEQEAQRLYVDLGQVGYQSEDCEYIAPYTLEIQQLKQTMDAEILCHHFMTADLAAGIADIVADATGLIDAARDSKHSTLIVCAIKPLAEAVKLVNPSARVLLPNTEAGCSIADGITAEQVRELKRRYPGVPAIAYVNSSAEVKAESDYVVTSHSARLLLSVLPDKQVLFFPDRAIAVNLQQEFPEKDIILWDGKCIVHEEYTLERIRHFREQHPDTHILLHSECDPSIIPYGNMHGGTAAMIGYVENHPEVEDFFIVTECGLGDTLRKMHPEKNFIGTCALCPYMKSINLSNTLGIMKDESDAGEVIEIAPEIMHRAREAIENTYRVTKNHLMPAFPGSSNNISCT